jgi:2-oxoglutarate dehydrogenase E2 component (dihydrolipoamide succinyltransferase)
MATSVTLPALGESVTEGTVTRWLKQPGDQVAVDEPLLEVSTDKVDTEIPSPVAGVLLEIKVQEDETVEVGAELCTVGDEGESGGSDAGESGEAAEAAESGGDEAADSGQEAAPSDAEQEEQSAKEAPAAEAQESAGGEKGAAGDEGSADGARDEGDRKTETETSPPAAQTDEGFPAQETAPASSHTSQEADAAQGANAATPVTLPALGESVTEGTVTRWLKQVGDDVAVDEPLLEVSTDKVDTEIPSPVAGTLLEIKVQEDETVEVGAELALVGSGRPAGGESAQAPAETPDSHTEETQDAGDEQAAAEARPSGDGAPEAGGQDEEATPAAEQVQPDAGAEAEKTEEEAPKQEEPKQEAPQQDAPKQEAPKQEAPKPAEEKPAAASGGESAYVTPLVRKMAAEHGVELSSVTGTGVGGRIRKQDVLDAAKAAEQAQAPAQPAAETPAPAAASGGGAPSTVPSPLRGKTEKLSRLRKVIAKRMVESLQTSAQLTTVVEVDVTRIARLRDAVKADFAAREGVKLSYMPFFAKAAIDALKQHPSLNAAIDTEAGEVTYYDRENVAIAVDTEKGLLTPVIKDAGDLSIAGLARKIADVAERTRSNKIGPDELSGGTFTLTNTGSRGALFDTPIINQPQVAILGTGTVVKRPVVIDDPNLGETIAVRNMCYLALTYDHRLVDGADAARFLSDVKQRLESGQFEV